jgi:preprotein translocase subunit YajC
MVKIFLLIIVILLLLGIAYFYSKQVGTNQKTPQVTFDSLNEGEIQVITQIWGVGQSVKTGKEALSSKETNRQRLSPKKDSTILLGNTSGNEKYEFKVKELNSESITLEWINPDQTLRLNSNIITIKAGSSTRVSTNSFDAGTDFYIKYSSDK